MTVIIDSIYYSLKGRVVFRHYRKTYIIENCEIIVIDTSFPLNIIIHNIKHI